MKIFGNVKIAIRKKILQTGAAMLKKLEWLMARYSPVGNHRFFDPALFPWSGELEANWLAMRRELDQVLAHQGSLPLIQDISKDQISISKDEDWKTFFLYGFGYKSEKNCALCPETTRLIEQVPGMMTAFFSILAPGKHIPEHRGPFKGIIRYHIGLKVPEPKELCRIRVDNETHNWEEGKSLIFDDSYYHEVWNDTNGTRVVLFMDVIRPLPFPLSLINRTIIKIISLSPLIQDARNNQTAWEEKFDQAVGQEHDRQDLIEHA